MSAEASKNGVLTSPLLFQNMQKFILHKQGIYFMWPYIHYCMLALHALYKVCNLESKGFHVYSGHTYPIVSKIYCLCQYLYARDVTCQHSVHHNWYHSNKKAEVKGHSCFCFVARDGLECTVLECLGEGVKCAKKDGEDTCFCPPGYHIDPVDPRRCRGKRIKLKICVE